MAISDVFKIKDLSKFDLFMELLSFTIFLDIYLYAEYSEGLLVFQNWNSFISLSNVGKIIALLIIYGMFRIGFATFSCHLLFKVLYKLQNLNLIEKKESTNTDNNFISLSVDKAFMIALETRDKFLEKRIEKIQKSIKELLRLSIVSVGTIILAIIDLIINKIHGTFIFSCSSLKNLAISVILITFFISLTFIIFAGYRSYYDDKIHYRNTKERG